METLVGAARIELIPHGKGRTWPARVWRPPMDTTSLAPHPGSMLGPSPRVAAKTRPTPRVLLGVERNRATPAELEQGKVGRRHAGPRLLQAHAVPVVEHRALAWKIGVPGVFSVHPDVVR